MSKEFLEIKTAKSNQEQSASRKKELQEYRKQVNELEGKSQEGFDKTLLALSSGALGLSLTFMKDIVTLDVAKCKILLISIWGLWALSLCLLLYGYNSSIESFQRIRKQIDDNEADEILRNKKHLGEPYRTRVIMCNKGGMWSFLLGVVLMIIFLSINLEVL